MGAFVVSRPTFGEFLCLPGSLVSRGLAFAAPVRPKQKPRTQLSAIDRTLFVCKCDTFPGRTISRVPAESVHFYDPQAGGRTPTSLSAHGAASTTTRLSAARTTCRRARSDGLGRPSGRPRRRTHRLNTATRPSVLGLRVPRARGTNYRNS